MQNKTNDAYRNDPLFPPVPKGYHERMEQVLESLPVEKRTVHFPKKRGIILLAAALAALLAVGTAVAISVSTANKLKEEVDARIEASDDERYAKARELAISRVDADGYPHIIPLHESAAFGDVTLKLVSIEVSGYEAELRYVLESGSIGFVNVLSDPDYLDNKRTQQILASHDTLCALGEDACSFVLNVEGTDYPSYFGDSASAAGFDRDSDECSTRFLNFPWKLENGTRLTFSGTLWCYDAKGSRIGEIGSFSIPFVYNYTAELREAEIDAMAKAYMEVSDAVDAQVHDNLTGLPEETTRLDAVVGMTTYLDVAADDQGLLLGLTQRFTEIGWIDYTYFCMNGYYVAEEQLAEEFAADDSSATRLYRLPYYADRQYLKEDVVTVACVRMIGKLTPIEPEGWSGPESWETSTFVFRYDLRTGAVTLPKDDAERDAWFKPQDLNITTTSLDPFYDYCETIDITGVSDTQNGTTVSVNRVAFKPDGTMYILFRADHLACEVIAWETVPKAVRINGETVTATGEVPDYRMDDSHIRDILNTYDMQKERWINSHWRIKPPMRRDMFNGPITIEIEGWDLYDLNAKGERVPVGTFSFSFTIPSDDSAYTVQPRFDVF